MVLRWSSLGQLLHHKSGQTFLKLASVRDSLHGSNYSSRTLDEDGTVYPVERPSQPLLRELSISGSRTQR